MVWPTPTSLSFAGSHQPGNSASANAMMALANQMEIPNWPTPATPATRDHKGVDRTAIDRGNARPLNEIVAHWSTPRATDGEKGGPNQTFGAGGVPLASQTVQWATPNAHERAQTPRRVDHGIQLANQADSWSTPTVGDVTGGHASRSGDRSDELLLNSQARFLSSRLDHPTLHGNGSPNTTLSAYQRYRATTCSRLRSERRALLLMAIWSKGKGWTRKAPTVFVRPSFRRSLNPVFVSWLMGDCPGSISFDFSEMPSFLCRAREHLRSLPDASHVEVRQQLDLWG